MSKDKQIESKITHLHTLNPDTVFTAEHARMQSITAATKDVEIYCSECNEITEFNALGKCMKCMSRDKISTKEVLATRAVVYEFICPECDTSITVGEEDIKVDDVNEHECCCCHSIIKYRCKTGTVSNLK